MPINAPPPTWDKIRSKPTTVAGFGITDMSAQSVLSAVSATNATNATNASNVPWSGVSSKPTTVAGLGLSDFNASAIAAQATASAGGVGTYVWAFRSTGGLSAGATVAGSAIVYAGAYDNGGAYFTAGTGTALSGTWRVMGQANISNAFTLLLRIS